MSVSWYFDWAKAHCIAFGFADRQAETVLAWEPVFIRLFSPDELHGATEHLAGREGVPKWAGDHREAIIAAIRHLRQKAGNKPPAAAEGYAQGVCIERCVSGLLLVPHPGLDEYGQWRAKLLPPSADPDGERSVNRGAHVCCVLCDTGREVRDGSVKSDRPMMTISQYEHLYPNWRDVVKSRADLVRARTTAAPVTPERLAELERTLKGAREAAERRARGETYRSPV